MGRRHLAETRSDRITASYDRMIKALLRTYPAELAAWLLGERPLEVTALDPVLAVVSERIPDKVLDVRLAGGLRVLLHVEFQHSGSVVMPERMSEYLSLLLRALRPERGERALPACVVVYLDPSSYGEDPGFLHIRGALDLEFSLRYHVIKLWERDPREILEMESPALLPFLPLTGGNPEELVLQSQERIAKAPESLVPPESKRELLAILAALAGCVIKDRAFLGRLFSEIRIMGENAFFDLVREEFEAIGLVKGREEGRREGLQKRREEGREQGREIGRKEEARRSIRHILERRFPPAEAPGARESASRRARITRLDRIDDLDILEQLLDEALSCATIEEFERKLKAI